MIRPSDLNLRHSSSAGLLCSSSHAASSHQPTASSIPATRVYGRGHSLSSNDRCVASMTYPFNLTQHKLMLVIQALQTALGPLYTFDPNFPSGKYILDLSVHTQRYNHSSGKLPPAPNYFTSPTLQQDVGCQAAGVRQRREFVGLQIRFTRHLAAGQLSANVAQRHPGLQAHCVFRKLEHP